MSPDAGFSASEFQRYDRQMILPGFGTQAQARLKKGRVLLIGMGGLGSPASMYLAAAGVGTLGIADHDKVDLSNLHRQILHDTPSIGTAKVESAARRLAALNPECRIVTHAEGVRAGDLPGLFAGYDVIVDCTDNFPTRYMVNDAAVLAQKPLVYGSIFQYEGQASFFFPAGDAPCYRCLFPEMPDPSSVPNCAQAGVIGALCGIVGSIQAMEALKFLAGVGETLAGRLLVIDAATMRVRTLAIKRDPHCPVCSAKARIHAIDPKEYEWNCEVPTAMLPPEISAAELAAILKKPDAPLLLDVRDEDECAIGMLPGAVNIPLPELGERWSELPKDRAIVACCLSGLRSARACGFLASKGFKSVSNLRGGVKMWARTVDPSFRF
jgi:adenylyltransferase/sulfurtransferase